MHDFKQIVTQFKNLVISKKVLFTTNNGAVVLKSHIGGMCYIVNIRENNYQNMPIVPYQTDLYELVTNVALDNDTHQTKLTEKSRIYQIYGVNLPDTFKIDELCKKAASIKDYFESYFRDEIFNTPEGIALTDELALIIEFLP